ncbi:MAG: hypothetical protein MJE68_17990, partial [Proteobacteria bacterium]|nr:hypothetical protein [Pseudomonadota bacterium]
TKNAHWAIPVNKDTPPLRKNLIKPHKTVIIYDTSPQDSIICQHDATVEEHSSNEPQDSNITSRSIPLDVIRWTMFPTRQ